MRTLANVLALLVAFGLATVVAGWWTVPVVAALWALARPGARPAVTAGAVAAVAWGGLLLATGPIASLGPQARVLGDVFGGGALVIIAVTLLFPATLAASAAAIVAALRAESAK